MLAMARVVRPVTGRAVVLTYDKTSMFKVSLNFMNYKLIIYNLNFKSLKVIVLIAVDRKIQRVLEARAAELRQHRRPRGPRVLLFED